ncbi:MAG: TolC family protein [Planctomycetes bacterium]|nr:TolC family protein [Planctomycetota bacterium]
MILARGRWVIWLIPALVGHVGCSTVAQPIAARKEVTTSVEVFTPLSSPTFTQSKLQAVKFEEAPVVDQGTVNSAEQFSNDKELTAEKLVAAVLARSPTVAQMTAAAQVAAARYPQVTSLEDPMFGATFGPASMGSREVDFAYRIEASQRLPYPGKRALRGANAQAEARAAGEEIEDARLTLTESARSALYDYFLAERALEVNRESLDLLRDIRQNAEARYKTGLVPQQDMLQADVEIGLQQERQLALERSREVAIARINTLMHLAPDAKLPPPPRELNPGDAVQNAKELRDLAVERRPDLRAIRNRLEAEGASLALAEREYKPDFEVMGAYDAFWQRPEQDLRTMIGLRMNVPVRYSRRAGAVAEAAARLAQRRAEYGRLTDQVNFEVQQAVARLRESEKAFKLYEGKILPAARENVKAGVAAYTTGKVPFLSLIEAQRNLVGQRDRAFETAAEYFRRSATLERVIGGPVPDKSPSSP